jgi:hypothetical protein
MTTEKELKKEIEICEDAIIEESGKQVIGKPYSATRWKEAKEKSIFLKGQLKVPNLLGTEPFDSDFTIYLSEINEADNNFIMRATQEVNKEQLTNATFDYLTKMANIMKIKSPKREDLKDLKNETLTASRIHGTGWIVYSVQTTTVTSDNLTNIEERIIELK